MIFQVVWSQQAVNDLAEIWNRGDSVFRQGVTRAAHAIGQSLQDDPFGAGESREVGVRVMFNAPLGVRFKVDQDSQAVIVGHVWRMPPRRGRG